VLLLAFLRIFAMRKHKAFELIWFKWVKRENLVALREWACAVRADKSVFIIVISILKV
jgi:hypothetical protein